MKQPVRFGMVGAVSAVMVLAAANVSAQSAPATAPQPATRGAAAPSPSAPAAPATAPDTAETRAQAQSVEEARARFQRALELSEDGDFDASLLELRRAYELAPSYKILYNIGLVYMQLKEHARAYDAFERYLVEGGSKVEPERATEVRHRLERLAARVGYLFITTTLPGAEVLIDDLHVGETPLDKPLRVDSGQRRVTIRLAGHPPDNRVIELAGGETRNVSFDLRVASGPPQTPAKSLVPWISWGLTAAVGAGAVVTGVLALSAESTYDSNAATVGENLTSSWDKLHTLSVATDVLIGVTILGAGISTYFTIRPPKVKPGNETAWRVFPGGVAGTF